MEEKGRSEKKYFERFISCDLGPVARVLCVPPVKQDSVPRLSVRRQLQVSGVWRINSAFHKATGSFSVCISKVMHLVGS